MSSPKKSKKKGSKSAAQKGSTKSEKKARRPDLHEGTVRGIVAILFFILAAFLILASRQAAGLAGEVAYGGLNQLLGVGYFFLPLLCLLLSGVFLRSLEHKFSWIHWSGTGLFLLSGLGIVGVLFPDHAGWLGEIIAVPLVRLFDTYLSLIMLAGSLLIAFLIIFNASLPIADIIEELRERARRRQEEAERNRELKAEPITEPALEQEEDQKKKETSEPKTAESDQEEEKSADPKSSATQGGWNPFGGSQKKKSDELEVDTTSGFYHHYEPPPLSFLEKDSGKPGVGDIKAQATTIQRTLRNFGVSVEMDEVSVGPTVTRYALKPAEGVKLSRIVSLQNDLALALAAHPLRIEAPIPGKSLVGIEIPNTAKSMVGLGTLLKQDEFQRSDKPLLLALGKSISGNSHFANLSKMPHLLIAGATGSGKSVAIHSVITSLLYRNSPENLRLIMVDPKRVELTLYNDIPHLQTPVITDPKKAIIGLKWAIKEMDRRYDILEAERVRDISSYHQKVVKPEKERLRKIKEETGEEPESQVVPMPYIVIIIDEMADLMSTYPRELEAGVVRLAQMSRAVGIHLLLSTQRPSVNVITGLIKANIPARLALQVSSQIDSRTILDTGGAERLLGAGDMLYLSGEMAKPQRLQSPFISEEEVKKVVKYLSKSWEGELSDELDLAKEEGGDGLSSGLIGGSDDDSDDDDLYEDAREVVIKNRKASASFLQRKLKVGYARASRLIDMLEERGVVGPADGAKPREVKEKPPDNDYERE